VREWLPAIAAALFGALGLIVNAAIGARVARRAAEITRLSGSEQRQDDREQWSLANVWRRLEAVEKAKDEYLAKVADLEADLKIERAENKRLSAEVEALRARVAELEGGFDPEVTIG
jgi:DNA repair exonuclease SbcCD ATPase subunit